jgi:CDP-diglyceride synthetase
MAFHEYDRIVDKIGAKVPYWTTLLATLLVVCDGAVRVGRDRIGPGRRVAADRAQRAGVGSRSARRCCGYRGAVLAPVYIGMPLGCLVGVHAIAGTEAVLLLIATVAVSDTAQFYTGRTFGARRWRRCAARRKRAKARSADS